MAKEITKMEKDRLYNEYYQRAVKLRAKRREKNNPYFSGTASHFFDGLPDYIYPCYPKDTNFKLIFHFKVNPDCNTKPKGFIVCCYEKDGKFYIGKHKAGNCPCWKKGYGD